MFTIDNINSNFQKYHNYYLTNVSAQPMASQAITPAQTKAPAQTPKQTRRTAKENNERTTILKNVDDPATKTAVSGGSLYVISLLLNKFSQLAGNALMRGEEFTSEANVRTIADEMVNNKKHKLNVIVDYIGPNDTLKHGPELKPMLEVVAKGQNAFFMEASPKSLAVAPKSKPSLMLHELGHAINASKAKNSIIKFLRNSRGIATYAPTALLLLNGMFKPKNPEKRGWVERNAGKLGFLAFAPTLVEEAAASIRGISAAKLAKDKGLLTDVAKNFKLGVLKKNYLLAFSTYLLSAIGLGIASKMAFAENKTSK